jgi:hypothetical protein
MLWWRQFILMHFVHVVWLWYKTDNEVVITLGGSQGREFGEKLTSLLARVIHGAVGVI